ncbi:MAG: Holliday junction branch migration protein RuvA [Saprospiraceae bacterium]|nr:Holliday junction branch migration protein RuvA [Saprospiraceae bacterium]
MIAYISGPITFKSPAYIYVEAAGVGYHINISLNTFSKIEHLEQVKILTYFHVKEDGQSLYGFYDAEERQIFIHLLSVSGIGPNTARVILSYMNPEEVNMAILQENVAALNAVKGIGPKTAKRIILDLKDKIAKKQDDVASLVVTVNNTIREEALSALLALGFPKAGVQKSISQVLRSDPSVGSVEDLIKKVLKQMS